jgi:hypothetical protein
MRKTFSLGCIVITSKAECALNFEDIPNALWRHINCDWSNLTELDQEMNNSAVIKNDGRIMSIYHDTNGTTFRIVTAADRSVTTILMPEELETLSA